MKRILGTIVPAIFLCLLLVLSAGERAAAVRGEWNIYRGEHFDVYYPEGYEHFTEEMIHYLQQHREEILEFTGGRDDLRPRIVVQDPGLLSNGYANGIKNKIVLFTSRPEAASGISSFASWPGQLAMHEYAHLTQMTNSSNLLSRLLGNAYSPNFLVPSWMMEGTSIAVESLPEENIGRQDDGYFDELLKDRIATGELPGLNEMTHTGDPYFYGSHIIDYLVREYGRESLKEFYDVNGRSYFFGLNFAAEEVYDKDLQELYAGWREEVNSATDGRKVERELLAGEDEGEIYDLTAGGDRVYFLQWESTEPQPLLERGVVTLRAYDRGSKNVEILDRVHSSPQGLEYDGEYLYLGIKDLERGNMPYINMMSEAGFEYTAGLYRYDPESGEKELLFTDKFNDFTVLDGEVFYVVQKDEGVEYWHYAGGEKELLGTDEGETAEIAATGGALYTISKPRGGSWGIYLLEPDTLDTSLLLETPQREQYLQGSGGSLYYTATYGGEYGVYRLEPETGRVSRMSDDTYAAAGLVEDESLFYIGLEDGERIFSTDAEGSMVALPGAPAARDDFGVDLEEGLSDSAFAANYKQLFKPYVWFPYFQGEDALGYNSYILEYFTQVLEFRTHLMSPMVVDYKGDFSESEPENEMVVRYPLYRSLTPGFSKLDLRVSTDFEKRYLGGSGQITYYDHEVEFRGKSALERDGYSGGLDYTYYHSESSLKLGLDTYFQKDPPGWDRLYLSEDMEGDPWYHGSLDYRHKLGEINKGLWSLDLFFSDLYGSLFVEGAEGDEEETYSFGYELDLETSTGYGKLKFAPVVGVYHSSREEARDIEYFLQFKTEF
ncbi:MAG: hypothetical protein ACOCQC_03815 [Halanaerobiaceae bacterium]